MRRRAAEALGTLLLVPRSFAPGDVAILIATALAGAAAAATLFLVRRVPATVLIPAALCVTPFFVRPPNVRTAVLAAALLLLLGFIVLGAASVGLLFVPSAVALWIALLRSDSAGRAKDSPG